MNREDAAFLAAYDPSIYERPSLAVDVVVFTVLEGRLAALVVQRHEAPQRGKWALPGGFVGVKETLDDAVRRVLRDKARLRNVYAEQLYTFSAVGRDPRTRVVSVAYMALVPSTNANEVPQQWAFVNVPWEGEEGGAIELEDANESIVRTAFDHAEILGRAVQRLRGKLRYAPVGYELLGQEFTLRDLQRVHEAILGRTLNKDSFRRTMLQSGQICATGNVEEGVAWRPAELYRFAD